jgi:hypothetical protein
LLPAARPNVPYIIDQMLFDFGEECRPWTLEQTRKVMADIAEKGL